MATAPAVAPVEFKYYPPPPIISSIHHYQDINNDTNLSYFTALYPSSLVLTNG